MRRKTIWRAWSHNNFHPVYLFAKIAPKRPQTSPQSPAKVDHPAGALPVTGPPARTLRRSPQQGLTMRSATSYSSEESREGRDRTTSPTPQTQFMGVRFGRLTRVR